MNVVPKTVLSPDTVGRFWADVLGVARIGPDDHLAEYGPDSLDTARVIARIRQAGGVQPPFRAVFEAATPRALADALRELEPAAEPAGRPATATDRLRWPLSYDQQRLWLLDQNDAGGDRGGGIGTAYHLRVVLELRGELDRVALAAAWGAVVARHGSLRTRFVLDGHEPCQEVLPSWPAGLTTVEVTGADVGQVLEQIADLAAPRFDLAAAPPWRAALYRLAADHHVLAFVIHHIVFDGWSEEVLLRELAELYAAHRAGRTPNLPALAVSYTDHAVRQRQAGHDTALEYWRRQLTGIAPLELPADRPRPAAATNTGAGHFFVVDAQLAAALRQLARAHRATPFMALLAAWSALLGRLCDVSDVVVGASTADRDRPELEDLIGMFVNVLVIRADVAGRRTFADLLDAVRETTLDAFAHGNLPFERLVAELAPERRSAQNPLFNVNFVYLNMPAAGGGWPGVQVRQLTTPTTTTAFDLILAVQDRPDGTLRCYLEYSRDLFDRPTVERIGGYYRRLLAGVVAAPDTPVGTVDILGDDERRELVTSGHTGRAAAPPPGCLHAVIEQQAGQSPTATAVVSGHRQLSYAGLEARANQLARHLRGQGVGPETAVAIRLPRSADQIVAMLAIWKAGGYYVPLDDEHPADRIAMMLADAAPLVLITRQPERVTAGEQAGVAKVVCLDRDRAEVDRQPGSPLGLAAPADALAAAIYTSGSTGTPKAVALTHRNVLSAQLGRLAFQAQPRCTLLPVSFAFDVFLSFAVWTLCSGGRLVIPERSRGADLDELAALLRSERVTHLIGPPDLQRSLLDREDVRAGNQLVLGVVGGQSCPQALADDYARSTDGARLVNEYGLTETSAGTYFITDGRDRAGLSGGQLPIGWPAAGFRVYLLDANLAPVPAGVPGELYVGGPGIARGYLDRPGATAERFVADPFGGAGGRLYRTGDLARRRSDGRLEFLGRRDRQVKVRGYRIELAEIEAALQRHETVRTAVVCYLPQRQELAAYLVGSAGGTPSGDDLRAHLRRLLPDPMVPSAFVVLDAMPLTPNGKIDREALAQFDVHQPPRVRHTPPRTPAERAIAAVWSDALGITDIDVHSDFFKIGGHSLLAAGVVSRMRAQFPVPIGLPDLFGAPTVAGLAEVIGKRMLAELRSQFGDEAVTAPAVPSPAAVPSPPSSSSPVSGVGTVGANAAPVGFDRSGAVRDYPFAPLGRLVAEQVARTPEARAVWAAGRWATYAEFGTEVNRLAAYLRRAGAGVDDVVGVCLPRGRAMVTAVHAVIAAGAAYLPLPPDQPAARLGMMIDDARPAAIITTADLAAKLDARGVRVVRMDTEQAAISGEPSHPPEVDVPPDALAYVIFTSGSTGRPKGVAVSHRAIANRLAWMQEAFSMQGHDRVLHKTPFSFDVSVWELFWPLLVGAGMVIADEGAHRDFDDLAQLAATTGVTTCHFVPSMLALFLDVPRLAARLRSMRRVVCSGEALSVDLVRRFRSVLPDVELHNLYGPTEAAVDVSWHTCDGTEDVVPIGRPVANTRLEILDRRGERVPVGEPGELHIAGVQLARGYVGRPALTAGRFLPDPYADHPGQRLYRTGDLARWRPDGAIEYLGRLDQQVKIRGVRIEPAEIEIALRNHPKVGGAAVQAWTPRGGETKLVAYVACPSGDAPTAGELREFLLARLPVALVPSRFVVLPRLPLTASGKLDRRALPTPEATGATGATAAPTPRRLSWLRREGNRTPLFCVHPGDGEGHWYAHLAEALGAEHPVAALQWPDDHRPGDHRSDDDQQRRSIDAVARQYLAELRAAQPSGPYRLFGWCGGAPVTWELARLLEEAGEPVQLWLLDPVVDVAQRPASAQQLELLRQAEQLFSALDSAQQPGDPAGGSGNLDAEEAAQRRADLVDLLRLALEEPGTAVTEEDARRQVRASRELLEAGIAYTFQPYGGQLRLLIGDDVPDEEHVVMSGQGYQQYLSRWRQLAAGGLRMTRVGGDHFGALRPPHAGELARLLAETAEVPA